MSSENTSTEMAAIDSSSTTERGKSGVLTFDENNSLSPAKDINTKITALDTDLAQLRAELGTINVSVEEGLDRLGDTDTDLTAKVSETYKRLGEIDNAYKSLMNISTRIDSDIQKLNGDVSMVAEQTATGIQTLEQSTITQSKEFAQKNQQVVTRVNQLLETSKLSGELLSQKIETTTEKLLQMETQVVTEIETLSSTVKQKTDSIAVSVESNKAKILKLQSVDKAIIKRATTLEITAAELTVKSQDLQISIEQLQQSSSKLSNGLSDLKGRTRALEDITRNHSSLISGLQKATSDITGKLTDLAGRESKHFNIYTSSFISLLIVIAVVYFSQQSQFDIRDAKIADRSGMVDSNIDELRLLQNQSAEKSKESLVNLENRVIALNNTMQENTRDEVSHLNDKLQNIEDHVISVDSRLTNDSPFSQIGDDNIIHGAQWISGLPEQNFTIQVAYADNVKSVFELAQHYNQYLDNALSYFEVRNAGKNGQSKYVLLSGNYATQKQANAGLESMPGYFEMRRPVVHALADVQHYIAQNK